jgi:Xaa-Pro dipeptidase
MFDLHRLQKAIREENLSAWLFYGHFHRDEIADLILEVPANRTNTRPWICLIPAQGGPVKIVHRIEASILGHIPGATLDYATREEYVHALRQALPARGRVGADFSATIPVGSFLDHGTATLLISLGVELAPSEGLVARSLGALSEEGRRTHEAAANVLYGAITDAWAEVKRSFREEREITEGAVRDLLSKTLAAARLESDGPPIVGAGVHTADPHFSVEGAGDRLAPGDVVQFDIWAKYMTPGAVYADISWIGVCAARPSVEQQRTFDAVVAAREAAVSLLQCRFAEGAPVTGAAVDRAAREVLIERGFGAEIQHRTGHSIGMRVHGYGVNLDSVEFPDERVLVDGACFSIEPGVYREDFGMRTEIDCVIADGRPLITGRDRQRTLLVLD